MPQIHSHNLAFPQISLNELTAPPPLYRSPKNGRSSYGANHYLQLYASSGLSIANTRTWNIDRLYLIIFNFVSLIWTTFSRLQRRSSGVRGEGAGQYLVSWKVTVLDWVWFILSIIFNHAYILHMSGIQNGGWCGLFVAWFETVIDVRKRCMEVCNFWTVRIIDYLFLLLQNLAPANLDIGVAIAFLCVCVVYNTGSSENGVLWTFLVWKLQNQ